MMQRYSVSFLTVKRVLLCQSCGMAKVSKRAKYFPAITTPMLPKGTFDGKIAFVTGGGTGLGKGIAKMLSDLGAQVMIASRNIEVLQKTADEINQQTNNLVLAQSCDIRDPLSVKTAVSECIQHLGLPNIIVNNAAGNFACPTERLSNNAWKTIVDIVLNGTANVTLDIGKRLIAAKQGASFLNISTVYVLSGSGYVVPSCAAKAGVEGLTKSLASEWGKYGMRFNCIQPGIIETKGAMTRLDPSGTWRENAIERVAVGRFGHVEEHSNLACYLLSDFSSWITGSIIRIDGGEYNYAAGQFNALDTVSEEQWDMLEANIRKGRSH